MVHVREVRDWVRTSPAYIGDFYEKYSISSNEQCKCSSNNER